ncbi:transcriptional regulator [Enterocloster clostridioformis]|nr:helix-turn-helix transcriptional regulator [Enterocloster clostridioformis]ANU49711.1 transcriptional regulator [Lachnoclostridium sp. YL32]NDO28838.1 helix-turn-helix transcriptional regulator [Enterocloster clostridioformis]OXE71237.1 transcriptional regulator [Enterocloster clostridioformis]QQR01380.1 helix-turn-helix transcriptional regulator [Enterocloster clostridioformis]
MVVKGMDLKRFGQKLKGKRKQSGYSCQELADLCHVNDGYIRQLEAGHKCPSMQLIFSICDILKTSPNYLFEYEAESVDKEILNRINKLLPNQKNELLYMLDAYVKYHQADE